MVYAFFVAMALSNWHSLSSTPRNVDRALSCIVRHIGVWMEPRCSRQFAGRVKHSLYEDGAPTVLLPSLQGLGGLRLAIGMLRLSPFLLLLIS